LNRLRIGEKNTEDIKLLQKRVIPEKEAESMLDACHIYYTNVEVDSHNMKMLSLLPSQKHCILAVVSVPVGCKSTTDMHGRVDSTSFMKCLELKVGARVMIIHNLDVIDELSNGVIGSVLHIQINAKGAVDYVLVEFDNPKVGIQQRKSHNHISSQFPDKLATPIYRIDFQYQLPAGRSGSLQHAASGKVLQFPLRLAWAVTCHKVQGQTFKAGTTVVIHWHKRLTEGMAYVMLGRCECLADLYISGIFEPNKIRCDKNAKEMSDMLEVRAILTTGLKSKWLDKDVNLLKICCFNTRSLLDHIHDIRNDHILLQSHVIGITETWLAGDVDNDSFNLLNYKLDTVSQGRGKGIAMYSKLPSCVDKRYCSPLLQFQVSHIANLEVVLVYRSSACSMQHLLEMLQGLEDRERIILGDLNFEAGEENVFTHHLMYQGYKQIVMEATHSAGRILDHCYTKMIARTSCFLHPLYFSDHDAICLMIAKDGTLGPQS
jgi:hypothetical protein